MKRRHFAASVSAAVAALALPRSAAAAAVATPEPRGLFLRTWEVWAPLPALRLEPGDTVTEATHDHALARHRDGTMAYIPAELWPTFLAAIVEGDVSIHPFQGEADPVDFLDDYPPEEALELSLNRYLAAIHARAAQRNAEVAW